MTMSRPAYKITANRPGSDIAAEYAAAFAVSHLVFKERGKWVLLTFMSYWLMIRIIKATIAIPYVPQKHSPTNFFIMADADFADKLLTHSKQLYDFAVHHKARYTDSVSEAAGYYR